MKRLIKFNSRYESDGAKFSTCSTEYTVLPDMVPDNAGFAELKALAKKHGIKIGRKFQDMPMGQYRKTLHVTHAVNVQETVPGKGMYSKEKYQVYLGFITMEVGGVLKPTNAIGKRITKAQAHEIVSNCSYGVQDVGEYIDGDAVVVMEGWEYFHQMRMLGYHHEQFQKLLKVEHEGFHDDTTRCDECNTYDSRDNGYTYNHAYIDGIGMLGKNCGCLEEHQKLNFEEHYADDSEKAIDRSTANELEKTKKIKRLETFIGGMVDGRGGYFAGKSTREGTPEAVLQEYQERMPNKTFIFIHEESGQFQTYFSIAEITKPKQQRKAA